MEGWVRLLKRKKSSVRWVRHEGIQPQRWEEGAEGYEETFEERRGGKTQSKLEDKNRENQASTSRVTRNILNQCQSAPKDSLIAKKGEQAPRKKS